MPDPEMAFIVAAPRPRGRDPPIAKHCLRPAQGVDFDIIIAEANIASREGRNGVALAIFRHFLSPLGRLAPPLLDLWEYDLDMLCIPLMIEKFEDLIHLC